MDTVIKTEWVRRLRSGDYTQGILALCQRAPDGSTLKHCCLGVLADMAVEAGVITRDWGVRDGYARYHADETEYDTTLLPDAVAAWAGLGERGVLVEIIPVDVGGGVLAGTLASANDAEIPFTAIADIIDQQL